MNYYRADCYSDSKSLSIYSKEEDREIKEESYQHHHKTSPNDSYSESHDLCLYALSVPTDERADLSHQVYITTN